MAGFCRVKKVYLSQGGAVKGAMGRQLTFSMGNSIIRSIYTIFDQNEKCCLVTRAASAQKRRNRYVFNGTFYMDRTVRCFCGGDAHFLYPQV